MRLKSCSTLNMAGEQQQLVVDPQSRFLEMKSLQPYSTTDEYLYAMKEDLADWLSTMYSDWRPITADTFLECLENGVLLCQHANNVNDAAARQHPSVQYTKCKYRFEARAKTFTARDNVCQFIKWARCTAGVREVLMFESDDLILRKNEKNFLLCLLEIARYGARFGVSVPALIKLEDEIEREIQRDKQIDAPPVPVDQQVVGHEEEEETPTFQSEEILHPWNERLSPIPSVPKVKTTDDDDERLVSNEVIHREVPTIKRTVIEKEEDDDERDIEPPASSSQLHKTVVQIVNSCCCAHRFPVIRIGEGKYRIGESGTIIFIRILRYHVMVRVGGGWDTLENYLNKHDPCRRSSGARRRSDHHHHHSDIPILAIPNNHVSPTVQKNTPFGKSVTIKTEEFPLNKPSNHDTNLVDAQLVITRGADGRHRIGQITYKAEEDTQPANAPCPQHHQSSPRMNIKSPRTIYQKQSSPSTDQDYSSLAETTSPSKPSSSSSLDLKEDVDDEMKTNKSLARPSIVESVIDCIDGYIHPAASDRDFDIRDIREAMRIEPTGMDNDSLESSEGVLEEKPPTSKKPIVTKQPVSRKKPVTHARYSTRSNTLPNVIDALKKESDPTPRRPLPLSINRYTSPRRKPPLPNSHRSQSTELLDKSIDISKLDRDSGFDEQDFRRERLHSNGDDNSSISSIPSARSSTARSVTSDYRENKSYELRMKKLDAKRQDLATKTRNSCDPLPPPPTSRDRKHSQPRVKLS